MYCSYSSCWSYGATFSTLRATRSDRSMILLVWEEDGLRRAAEGLPSLSTGSPSGLRDFEAFVSTAPWSDFFDKLEIRR